MNSLSACQSRYEVCKANLAAALPPGATMRCDDECIMVPPHLKTAEIQTLLREIRDAWHVLYTAECMAERVEAAAHTLAAMVM